MLIPSKNQTTSSREDIENLYPKLKSYCLRMTRNYWDAEDLAHDTIAKSISFCNKKWPEEREISLPFLATVARNHWVDQVRKQSRLSVEMMQEPLSQEKPLDMLLEAIDSLIEKLTPKQLLVFVLKEIFVYQLSDISQMLELTETTVKSLLHRARRNIHGDSAAAPFVEEYWNDEEKESFRSRLLHAIKLEKPELLQELIHVKSAQLHPAPRRSMSSITSLLCAA